MNDTLIEQLEKALTDAVNNEMSMKQACSHFDLMAIITGLKKKTEMHYATREALEGRIEELKQEAGATSSKANLGCATTGELLYEIRARLALIDKLNYRTADWVDEDKPKKKRALDAFPSDAMWRLEELEEIIKQVVGCNVGIKAVYPCIVSHLKSLKEIATSSEASPVAEKLLNIFDKMQTGPGVDKLLQSIMVLSYLCHDHQYSLSIKRPYNTTRWHVTASRDNENEIIETASSPHLPDAVMGLRDFLVGDRDGRDAPAVDKTPAQVMADLETNALDVIAEVKKIKKKTEVDRLYGLIERSTKRMVDAIERVGLLIRAYSR